MNISSVNHQQIQHPPPYLHSQVSDDLLLDPPPVSSARNGQHALLGVALSRNISSNVIRLPAATRKDKHSKILTAQGLRDRRVRLSVGIARRFFDLQEMLGFDKASETVDWLLGKAAESIKILARSKSSPRCSRGVGSDASSSLSSKRKAMPRKGKEKKAKPVSSTKSVKILNDHARDRSRAQARARARERTLRKLINGQLRAFMRAQFDGNARDVLTSQSPESNIPPTTEHRPTSPIGELKVAKQNVATGTKASSDLLRQHKDLVISDVNNFNSFEGFLPTEWYINGSRS